MIHFCPPKDHILDLRLPATKEILFNKPLHCHPFSSSQKPSSLKIISNANAVAQTLPSFLFLFFLKNPTPSKPLAILFIDFIMAGETRLSINNLRTTMQIIKQTTATFNTNFSTLILLSRWLFTFRTLIENGIRNLTRDASLDSFFSRLDLADRNYGSLHPLRPTFDRDDPSPGKTMPTLPPSSLSLSMVDPSLSKTLNLMMELSSLKSYILELNLMPRRML
ncbi:hypothetical protein Peur_034614 [Populus x canadensis]